MPNIKLHEASSNAIVELDTDAIVYRIEYSTVPNPYTHLALAYNYTLDVKETPEQIDILANGGSLDDWIVYNGYGVCPVPKSRKVIVRKRVIEEIYVKGEWCERLRLTDGSLAGQFGDFYIDYAFVKEIPTICPASAIDWDIYPTQYCEPINKFQREDPVSINLGVTHYKIIGY